MWRYIKAAFWAKAQAPLVGPLPFNALAVFGFGVLGGAVDHAFWLMGAGLEAAYLYALATNPRFQAVIAAMDGAQARIETDPARQELFNQLSLAARSRLEGLRAKLEQIRRLYRLHQEDSLLVESSLDALEKLADLHFKLLIAERNLQAAQEQTDPAELFRKAGILEKALADPRLAAGLRESKQATLELVRKRLANAETRSEALVQTESDLARIETQIDLALEEAGMNDRPSVSGGNLNLLNQILESNSSLSAADEALAGGGASALARKLDNREAS